MIDIESNYKPNCRGKLKLTYQAAPYWIYVFGTFSVIRKEGQDVGLRINRKFKNASASDCEKYIILGDPNVDFTLPIDLQLDLSWHAPKCIMRDVIEEWKSKWAVLE